METLWGGGGEEDDELGPLLTHPLLSMGAKCRQCV